MADHHQQPEEEFVKVTVVEEAAVENTIGKKSSRSFIEVLLNPKSLQGLMACGAGLLVVGLVVWLWSVGVFENPVVVATCLGITNCAVVAAGMATARYTRYQTAGKAITMLGCLVMPLNLWFYDAQGLITLDQGGHLWVPAVACCLIYASVARVLADPKFVFAIVGGVAMTGLLLLADQNIGRFWEILSPSTLLVVIGMICIHAERAFASGEGPFSRQNFGKAFFQAGHTALAAGLLLLLGGRLCGLFYETFFADLGWFAKPLVSTQTHLKLFALLLAMAGAYSYVYSQLVVRAGGRYIVSAVLTVLWAAVILLDLLSIPFTMSLVTLLLAVTALALNMARTSQSESGSGGPLTQQLQALLQSSGPIVSGLHVTTGLLGLLLYGRARLEVLSDAFPYQFEGLFIVAMSVASASCVWSAIRAERESKSARVIRNWQLAAVFAMFSTAGTLSMVGIPLTAITLVAEMLIPLAIVVASLVTKSEARRLAWSRAAELVTCLLLIVGLAAILGLVEVLAVAAPHLWLSLLFAASSLSFGMASVHSRRAMSPVLSAISLCVSVWQTLLWLDYTQYAPIVAATTVGLVALVAARLLEATGVFGEKRLKQCHYFSWVGIGLGGVAALLLSLARVLVNEANASLLGLLAVQIVASLVAALLTRQDAWRRSFLVLAAGEVLVTMLVVNVLSPFTFLQKSELLVTCGGLIMLAFGYYGWFRETERRNELVSFNLAFGSILSSVPLLIGLLQQRIWGSSHAWGWVMLHEIGVLAVGLGLLGIGIVCRIRSSTLLGSGALTVYVVSLLGLLRIPNQLQTTAIYMMVGGGLFFLVAVLLSIYRDRLLALPEKVREGEGVFQVLKWR